MKIGESLNDVNFPLILDLMLISYNRINLDISEVNIKKMIENHKESLKELLPIGSIQVLKTEIDRSGEDKKGKFGRILGDFLIDDKRATDILIEEGHAVAYFGGSKEEINMKHLANREKLLREGVVSREDYDAAVALMS